MSNLTERLRALSSDHDDLSWIGDDAADEIERLHELAYNPKGYEYIDCLEQAENEIEELKKEVDHGESNLLSLLYDVAELRKKTDKMREVLTELQQCSEYWSEYVVPLGIHERIKEALNDDA
jgi:uncharacterized coiled-coil DUF342 family protein